MSFKEVVEALGSPKVVMTAVFVTGAFWVALVAAWIANSPEAMGVFAKFGLYSLGLTLVLVAIAKMGRKEN